MMNHKTSAIILAGGSGTRMMLDKAKQFIDIYGKTVIERSVKAFDMCDEISEIIVVVKDGEEDNTRQILAKAGVVKPLKLVAGGKCRAESAKNGFKAVSQECDFVAIHDAARCLITSEMIAKVVNKAYATGAATAACGVTDTIKIVEESGKISATIPRDKVFKAQTPQVFKAHIYSEALKNSDACLSDITDDNMLVESIGLSVYAVDLGETNLKITTQNDLSIAKRILEERGEGRVIDVRIGHGYDVHKLVEDRKLIIGGVDIPYYKGLLGHSDADVLTHAIMDSLLGAAGLGDIGRHFPDTKEEYAGISSIHLLRKVSKLLNENGYAVVNIDATLVMQKPKVAPYVENMIANVADTLGISRTSVNIKATTEEHLGFTGREEGASAHAVALIRAKK